MSGMGQLSKNTTKTVRFGGMDFTFTITPDEEMEERRLIEERLKKRDDFKKVQKMQLNSLMNTESKNKRFDNFEITQSNKKYYEIAYSYAKNFEDSKRENLGFMFSGTVGTGKSHLSYCIANHLLDQNIPVVAVGHGSLIQKMKEVSKFGSEDEIRFFNTLAKADLLIIDDLGAYSKSDWAISKLYEVIDARYNSNLPLIVSTNLTTKQLREYLDTDGNERIWDRLIEMCTQIEFNCESWRIKKGKEKQKVFRDLIIEGE